MGGKELQDDIEACVSVVLWERWYTGQLKIFSCR